MLKLLKQANVIPSLEAILRFYKKTWRSLIEYGLIFEDEVDWLEQMKGSLKGNNIEYKTYWNSQKAINSAYRVTRTYVFCEQNSVIHWSQFQQKDHTVKMVFIQKLSVE